MSKSLEALSKYKTNFSDQQISEAVSKIIAEKFDENNNVDVYKKLYSLIDMTTLNTTDSKESVWKFTEAVNDFEGIRPDVNNVAAICVYPNFVGVVREALTAQNVKIACVSGGFPSSQTLLEIKVAETALAVADGTDEVDIVLNLGLFLEGSYDELCEEIQEIKAACRDAHLKVILETGALKTAENIRKASILSLYSGADFLKTSTGKVYEGATLEAAYIMCLTLKEYYQQTGIKCGFKASGGISTTDSAVKYYTIVKEVLGEEWLSSELFRIGASSLAANLLQSIGN